MLRVKILRYPTGWHFHPLYSIAAISVVTFGLCGGSAVGQPSSVITVPPAVAPSSIGQNTQLNLLANGVLGSSFVAQSISFDEPAEVNIQGGTVGDSFGAGFASRINISGGVVGNLFKARTGSEVNISGGRVGSEFKAFDLSTVNISGGSVGPFFEAFARSSINVSGGTIGEFFRARDGSVVNITGGTFDDHFTVRENGVVNVSGGTFGDRFNAIQESKVHFFGTNFRINNEPLEGLVAGQAFEVADRDVTLSGILHDGSPFSFELNSTFNFASDIFSPNGTLTVTLVVPEPTTCLLISTCVIVGVVGRRPRS